MNFFKVEIIVTRSISFIMQEKKSARSAISFQPENILVPGVSGADR
jgi:hypothetical protein